MVHQYIAKDDKARFLSQVEFPKVMWEVGQNPFYLITIELPGVALVNCAI